MSKQDQAIDQNFEFFQSNGTHEYEPGWYCREGFDGGPVDDDCSGPFKTQWDARKAMRLAMFVE